jgi:aromatic ring-cleaving dioxygenase
MEEFKMQAAAALISPILGWHCHVYFPPEDRETAVQLNKAIQEEFKIWDYRWLNESNILHPTPMFRFQFDRCDLGRFFEWMTLHRQGLSILVHAITGDDIFDHSYNIIWMGTPLALDLDALRDMQEKIRRGELPSSLLPASQVRSTQEDNAVSKYAPDDDMHAK